VETGLMKKIILLVGAGLLD